MLERYVIHTTKICNMDCTYCYEHDKTSTYTWDEIQNILDGILKNNTERRCSIEFLGGEPLIGFSHIKDTVEYMEAAEGFEVDHYLITTNGTILNDEIMQWLRDNPKVFISISIDGGHVANMLRIYKTTKKTTLKDVEKNSKFLLEEFGPNRIFAHMVTHPWNVYLTSKSVKYIYNLGFRDITVGIIESTGDITQEYADRLIQEMHKVSNLIKKGEYQDLRIDMFDYVRKEAVGKKYIKDPETGKVLAETYGRAEHDLTHVESDLYMTIQSESPRRDLIYQIRDQIFTNHHINLQEA
ncbi:radical SAM protein [Lysinibacillus pakistanensis]|uniref:radical SAM protein n=1 Tax=Lysinibacillus pakistanensis TaxID=759811 RepID=UPI003D26BAFC